MSPLAKILIPRNFDLIQFPNLIWYQTGHSLYVLRQASRRSWRIGQKEPVKVKFLYYEDTLQASCLRLMGKKLLVSLAMEGKFSNEGLQAIDAVDDLLVAMARELVNEESIGESADAVWRDLRHQQQQLQQVKSTDQISAKEDLDLPEEDSEPEIPVDVQVLSSAIPPMTQLALFEHFHPTIHRQPAHRPAGRRVSKGAIQPSLF